MEGRFSIRWYLWLLIDRFTSDFKDPINYSSDHRILSRRPTLLSSWSAKIQPDGKEEEDLNLFINPSMDRLVMLLLLRRIDGHLSHRQGDPLKAPQPESNQANFQLKIKFESKLFRVLSICIELKQIIVKQMEDEDGRGRRKNRKAFSCLSQSAIETKSLSWKEGLLSEERRTSKCIQCRNCRKEHFINPQPSSGVPCTHTFSTRVSSKMHCI